MSKQERLKTSTGHLRKLHNIGKATASHALKQQPCENVHEHGQKSLLRIPKKVPEHSKMGPSHSTIKGKKPNSLIRVKFKLWRQRVRTGGDEKTGKEIRNTIAELKISNWGQWSRTGGNISQIHSVLLE